MSDPLKTQEPKRPGWIARIRSNFLTGLVIIAPIGLTAWLIWSVIGWIDGFVLPLVPDAYQPDLFIQRLLGRDLEHLIDIRGIGVVVFLVFTVFVGWLGKGLIGRSLLRWAEGLVNRMPVVRSIYSGVKQIAETIFSQKDNNFEKACLVEYPRRGMWAVGFISTKARGEIAAKTYENDGPLVSVFLPTTPNPTSGYMLFVPKSDVKELDMSVEDAAKLIISAGLVYPNDKKPVE
ncbi:MAG: DUF502 domain-containing protein [Planktomarina sp.]